jgi:hypothetical protein
MKAVNLERATRRLRRHAAGFLGDRRRLEIVYGELEKAERYR